MSTNDLDAGPTRAGGIRNGGLLLVLVAVAAVIALVDEPPQVGGGRRLPGIFQSLTPPTGITGLPPAGTPSPPATSAGDGERPAAAARAHPYRQHPRPAAAGAPGRFGDDVGTRAAGDRGGSGPGSGATPPPVTTAPVDVTPVARVRVPPVPVRVAPPPVAGRELPEVRAATPEVRLDSTLP